MFSKYFQIHVGILKKNDRKRKWSGYSSFQIGRIVILWSF